MEKVIKGGSLENTVDEIAKEIIKRDKSVSDESIAAVGALQEEVSSVKSALINDLNVNVSVSPKWEQGFWSSSPSTTRMDYVRTRAGIPVVAEDVITVDMSGYTGTEVQFNLYSNDTYVSRILVRSSAFSDGLATATMPSDTTYDNVRINIYSGGSSIYIDPSTYASVGIYKNLHPSLVKTVDSLFTDIPIPFEVGAISITSNGWTYPNENTTKRIRTIANQTIRLYAGDVIKITPEKSIRIYLGWRAEDGTHGANGWYRVDQQVNISGDYVISVAYNPDADITDFNDMANSVYIRRNCGKYSHELEVMTSDIVTQYMNFGLQNRCVHNANHRGWYTAPENTIVAFAQSKYYGFDCVETDVRATSDGVFVLLHDDTINRTSNGTGNIADMTFDEVRQYDFGSWKASKYTGTQIPTLEEMLTFCKWVGISPYLEVKNVLTDVQVREVVDIVGKYGMLSVATFFGDAHVADVISDHNHDVRVGIVLFSDVSASAIESITLCKNRGNDVFLDVQMESLTDTGVELARAAGIPVEVWNVTKAKMDTAKSYISGFTADDFVPSLYMAQSVYKPNV